MKQQVSRCGLFARMAFWILVSVASALVWSRPLVAEPFQCEFDQGEEHGSEVIMDAIRARDSSPRDVQWAQFVVHTRLAGGDRYDDELLQWLFWYDDFGRIMDAGTRYDFVASTFQGPFGDGEGIQMRVRFFVEGTTEDVALYANDTRTGESFCIAGEELDEYDRLFAHDLEKTRAAVREILAERQQP
jgi:hypothetical protein